MPDSGSAAERPVASMLTSATPLSPPQRYAFLDGLRGLVALYVLVYHFIAWVPSILPGWITKLQRPLSFGHVAVSIFIVLSGFSLTLPIARSATKSPRGGVREYLRRRAWRILPPYIAALAVAVVLTLALGRAAAFERAGSWPGLAAHLLLVHNLRQDWAMQFNMAHWSVAAEWQIYFFLPLLILPLWRRFGITTAVLASFAAAAIPLVVLPTKYNLAWTCPWYIGLFALGSLTAVLQQARSLKLGSVTYVATMAVLAAAYMAMHVTMRAPYNSESATSHPWPNFLKDSIAGLIVAVGISFCFFTSQNGGFGRPFMRLLESRVCVGLGAFSYSLYLTHASILEAILHVSERAGWTPLQAFFFRSVIGVPVAIGFAYCFYRIFERPFVQVKSAGIKPIVPPNLPAAISQSF